MVSAAAGCGERGRRRRARAHRRHTEEPPPYTSAVAIASGAPVAQQGKKQGDLAPLPMEPFLSPAMQEKYGARIERLKEQSKGLQPRSPAQMRAAGLAVWSRKIVVDENQDAYFKKTWSSIVASSRTFCFLHELEILLANNLIKGGDVNNAIVIVEEEVTKEKLHTLATAFNKSDIRVTEAGVLNNVKLRHKNEPARHKLLDVIGDLALVGKPIKGKITAYKPGHKNNTAFAKQLKKIMEENITKIAPKINFDETPLYSRAQIKTILPHRDPFLFIDEIRELGEDYIVGIKFVDSNEEYFKGHFPGEPVMPGVLQLETMAQAGGVLLLSTVENPEDYLTFFMKIDNAKFKKKVVPGDTIVFRLNLISPIRRGLCHMHGKGFVEGDIVVEADLLAQIVPKK